jgi:hypothetical protein
MSALPELPETTHYKHFDTQTRAAYTANQMREYGDARAAHARQQAMEEAVEQADEWSSYVIEDNAPESLRARMEKLK